MIGTTKIFVIVPALDTTGPMRGAAALCNGLANTLPVVLVALKRVERTHPPVDARVTIVSLAGSRSWFAKRAAYRRLLSAAAASGRVVSISYCLSADLLNATMRHDATIISSVRGNLMRNYYFDYGPPGWLAALCHLRLLRLFHRVVAMSDSMATVLRKHGLTRIVNIGNFVDEAHLSHFRNPPSAPRSGPFRFIFLASLTRRKRPDLVLAAMKTLHDGGISCCLDIVGTGPLQNRLEDIVQEYGLGGQVTIWGQLPDPYRVLQAADCLVLPSRSEGISRAVLEALFFGVPCILRNVDANDEVIVSGVSGAMFKNDDELADVMQQSLKLFTSENNGSRTNLLPSSCQERPNIQKFLNLICA